MISMRPTLINYWRSLYTYVDIKIIVFGIYVSKSFSARYVMELCK